MKFWYLLSVCIVLHGDKISGLRCWKCENARTEKECIEKGYSQQCRHTETVCQTEVRYSVGWGKRPMIRTSCKEGHACNDNFVQNPRSAWGPTQCNGGRFNSVCRCCCNESLCNRRDLLCERPGSCRRLPKVPNRGKVTCTNGTQLSSRCTFTCDEGYELVGRRAAVCFKFPKKPMWNRRTPICRNRIDKCRPVSTPTNGAVTCSSSRLEVGTVCKFSCNNGLLLKGAPDTTCVKILTTPRWDKETPSCIGVCDSISAPENGRVDCTGSNEVGKATCVFHCNKGFRLVGFESTSCIDTTKGPEWRRDTPKCTAPPKCPALGDLRNGQINCTGDDNEVGTTCSFNCTTVGYDLLPINRLSTNCEAAPNGLSRWTKLKPCCNAQCPPVAKKDIVIVIDSSSSITDNEWKVMKRILVNVTKKFNISDDAVRIAAFRFNQHIDNRSQILFGNQTKDELVAAFQNISKDGSGTNIGLALQYAKYNVLTVNNRPNVTDMVFVMTDGQSNDEFNKTAKDLRDAGVQIVVLGIFKDKRDKTDKTDKTDKFRRQLIDMTGHEDLVLEVANVSVGAESDLVTLIVDKICEVSCE